MRPCPKCGCQYQRLAYRLNEAGTSVALACFNRTCDFTGPYTGMTFPPDRRDCTRAAGLWDTEVLRLTLPAFLRSRLPAPAALIAANEPLSPDLNTRSAGKKIMLN